MYRALIAILTIMISNAVLALDAEYKNTLTKVELNKTSDSSYSVNLYTAKQFSEPVKVIKKSDLNYYILLPETKNSIKNVASNSSDIRSIDTQSFPYAGADVKNGYTKININTTKPISFAINTKLASSQNIKPIVQKEEKQEIKTAANEAKVQKKNLVQEPQKPKRNSVEKKSVKTVQKTETKIKKAAINPKAAAKIQKKKPQVKVVKAPVKKEIKTEDVKSLQPVKPVQQEIIVVSKEKQEDIKEPENNTEESVRISEEKTEEIVQDKDNITDTSEEEIVVVKKQGISKRFYLDKLKTKIINKLYDYGLSVKELFLMFVAGLISFVTILYILAKGQETQTRLKSKADFADKAIRRSGLVAKKGTEDSSPDSRYFVFDNNVKQTVFTQPISPDSKNYELSSYNPNIQQDSSPVIEPYVSGKAQNDDIIQKILRDDIEIETPNNPVVTKVQQQEEKQVATKVQNDIKPEQKIQEVQAEPEILSSVEIAPQRGFMCVSYNDSISLVGYIFDDVFALYNFNRQKLENYTIKFRLSEKTPQGANFLVRVEKSKLLISVTKSSMKLVVAM